MPGSGGSSSTGWQQRARVPAAAAAQSPVSASGSAIEVGRIIIIIIIRVAIQERALLIAEFFRLAAAAAATSTRHRQPGLMLPVDTHHEERIDSAVDVCCARSEPASHGVFYVRHTCEKTNEQHCVGRCGRVDSRQADTQRQARRSTVTSISIVCGERVPLLTAKRDSPRKPNHAHICPIPTPGIIQTQNNRQQQRAAVRRELDRDTKANHISSCTQSELARSSVCRVRNRPYLLVHMMSLLICIPVWKPRKYATGIATT